MKNYLEKYKIETENRIKSSYDLQCTNVTTITDLYLEKVVIEKDATIEDIKYIIDEEIDIIKSNLEREAYYQSEYFKFKTYCEDMYVDDIEDIEIFNSDDVCYLEENKLIKNGKINFKKLMDFSMSDFEYYKVKCLGDWGEDMNESLISIIDELNYDFSLKHIDFSAVENKKDLYELLSKYNKKYIFDYK